MTTLRRAAPAAVLLNLVAAALATAALADSSITLTHEGDDRSIIIEADAAEAEIRSHGDGGSLTADLTQSEEIDILHMGGASDAEVILDGVSDTVIAIGHCPPGTILAPVTRSDSAHGLIIPRCVY